MAKIRPPAANFPAQVVEKIIARAEKNPSLDEKIPAHY